MKKIIIATKNKGKILEFRDFFRRFDIEVASLLDLESEMPDIAETGATFEENAAIKAEAIAALLNQPVLADDSGLMVDALNGEPGVYSARYAGEAKSDEANNEKLLKELENTVEDLRTAQFVCVLAIAKPGEETIFRTGYCNGKIGFFSKGNNGFGYDPLFIPNGFEQTMAELSPETKNKISHRSQAIGKLEEGLSEIIK
jgi:XTP/dITP diphosphohydrolase